jgi:4-diphosphocytidyl-2-C-methyl-D-erythritol kinase
VTTTRDAPAKINLWLRVGARQPSGFHDLDTLFCALDLADTVTLSDGVPGAGVRLRTSFAPPLRDVPDLGPDADNLAVRAATGFLAATGLPADVDIHLVKRIPPGSGLGGGSTDAAAVLRAFEDVHPGALPPERLHDLAAGLGSDVPFFVSGLPLAHGAGRGDRLTGTTPLPARTVLLVLPELHVSTTAAYRWLDDDRAHGREPSGPHAGDPPAGPLDWDGVADRARNDFEPVVFRRHPELGGYRDVLADHGARPALMSGSGSTLFGVFHDETGARAAAADFASRHPELRTVVTRTRSR